jgi:predicted amidohydrolase
VPANAATAAGLVESATRSGARLVVLPELFLTGYDPAGWSTVRCLEDPYDGRLDPVREASAAHRAVVVVGAALRRPALVPDAAPSHTVTLLVFEPHGETTAPYDKQHLFDAEREFFVPGGHGASLVLDDWEIGLGICHDSCFPEHAVAAAADGADAYLCPSAYYRGAEHRRDLYYAARALDNGIYVVFSGLTGTCGDYAFSGGSAVYDPEGRPLDRVGDESPAIAYADLDQQEVARVRAMNPIGRDRLATLGKRERRVLAD